jgi:hypothetical protein
MSIIFACIPELLKPKVKEAFPEVTFLKVDDMDASMHGPKRNLDFRETDKPRKKKVKVVDITKQDDRTARLENTSERFPNDDFVV